MKNQQIKKCLLVAFTFIFMYACTTDDSVQMNPSSTETQQDLMARGSSDFRNLFNNLYGSNYAIGTRTMLFEDNITYYVTEINRLSGGSRIIQGYVLETASKDFYFEHISSAGTLNQYTIDGTGYVRTIIDISQDQNYLNGGFTPFGDEDRKFGRRFFGTGYSWGACGPNSNGTPGCFQGLYETYYVFWIGGETSPSLNENTGAPITQPCECP